MYNLTDFIPYTGKLTNGSEIVVAWSKKSGYHFLQAGFCIVDVKIIGVKEKKEDGLGLVKTTLL